MLENVTLCKYTPLRALAVIFTAVILAASILAPFTYIVNGQHIELRFHVDDIEKEYEVSYGGDVYTIEVTIPGDLYYHYADKPRLKTSENGNHIVKSYASYVVIDEVVQNIADQLKEIADSNYGGSDYALASLILDFVHQTPYLIDSSTSDGKEIEYPKTPVETLVDQGDCEDLSALYTSIALAAGLDAVMFMFPTSPGHMAAGVHVNDSHGLNAYYTSPDGVTYYFCETTSSSAKLGYSGIYSSPNKVSTRTVISDFPNA